MAVKTNIEEILEKGIDIPRRRIYFGGNPVGDAEFEWGTVELAVRAIHIMESKSAQPIELHMNSRGGCPNSMLRLIDIILTSPCQFKFIGSGTISSSAVWVMAICDERYLHENTRVLIHDSDAGETSLDGHITDAYIDLDQEKILQDRLNQVLADNSRMPKTFWDDIIKRNNWISASEAVSLGIADKIIEHHKRGNLRKMRIAKLSQHPDRKDLTKLVKDLYKRTYKSGISKIEVVIPTEEYDPNIIVVEEPLIDPLKEQTHNASHDD